MREVQTSAAILRGFRYTVTKTPPASFRRSAQAKFCPMQEVQKSAAILRGFRDTVTKTHSSSLTSGARNLFLSYAGGAKLSEKFDGFS